METRLKKLLHAGCGTDMKPAVYGAYRETRLDASREVLPDVVASVSAMPMLDGETYDAVYCSHCLEHLPWHEVGMALKEFWRVLRPGGLVDLRVPDLQAVAGRIACDEPECILYQSPIGPVTPLDVVFGHRATVAQGHRLMGHQTGFTASSLTASLVRAGFTKVTVERAKLFELKALAFKEPGDAGEESEAAGIPERPLRACVGEAASLR